MKKYLLLLLIGTILVTCKLNIPTQPLPTTTVRYPREADSCLNMAVAFTHAADALDLYTSSADIPDGIRILAAKLQVQYLDSAAMYKKQAELLAKGD